MKLINPLFNKQDKINNKVINNKVINNKVEASASPISNKEMSRLYIISMDNKKIPVEVDFENRVCLPVKKVL